MTLPSRAPRVVTRITRGERANGVASRRSRRSSSRIWTRRFAARSPLRPPHSKNRRRTCSPVTMPCRPVQPSIWRSRSVICVPRVMVIGIRPPIGNHPKRSAGVLVVRPTNGATPSSCASSRCPVRGDAPSARPSAAPLMSGWRASTSRAATSRSAVGCRVGTRLVALGCGVAGATRGASPGRAFINVFRVWVSCLVVWLIKAPGSRRDSPTVTARKAKQFNPLQR